MNNSEEEYLTDSKELFRAEALAAKDRSSTGTISIATPISFYVVLFLLILAISIFLVFSGFTEYARKDLVKGRLVPKEGAAQIYSQNLGVISEFYVTEGQSVVKGENLVAISSNSFREDGSNALSYISNQLRNTESMLTKSIENESLLISSVTSKILKEIDFKKLELEEHIKFVNISTTKFKLAQENFEKLESMKQQKLISDTDYQSAQNEYLSQKAILSQAKTQKTILESDIAKFESDLELQKLLSERNSTDLKLKLAETNRELAVNDVKAHYLIKAPVSGVVTSLQFKKGMQTSDVFPLLTILPEDYALHAELYVPSKSIGFVTKNTPIKIMFDAYPYQKFGSFTGNIITISKSVVKGDELRGYRGNEGWLYKIVVDIDVNEIPKQMNLHSGMEISAYMLSEKRTVFEWLFEPLFSIGKK